MATPTPFSVDARISSHEAVCAERWNQIRVTMGEMQSGIKGLYRIVLIAGGALIAGMAGLIVTLALHGK